MKPILNQALILLSIFFSVPLSSQAILCPDDCSDAVPPIGEEGAYEVQRVIEVESMSSSQLYGAAKSWFAATFQSSQDVIQVDDPSTYLVVGRGWSPLNLSVLGMTVSPKLWYKVKIEAKDGRYRYTIFDMEYDASNEMAKYRVPLSDAFFEDRYRKGKMKNRDKTLRREWINSINNIAASIESTMASSDSNW